MVVRNYYPVADRTQVTDKIPIPVEDRELIPLENRDYMGGTALATVYHALPAYSSLKSASKIASYSAMPSYSRTVAQKVLKRYCINDCHVWHKNAESGYNYHGYDVPSHYDNRIDIYQGVYDQLCQFDPFPTGGTVSSAYLYVCLTNPIPTCSYATQRITASWSEYTVTYNSIKNYLVGPIDAGSFGGSGWQSISVLGVVKDWIEGGAAQYGICLSGHYVPATDPIVEWYNRHQFSGAYNCYIIATINF